MALKHKITGALLAEFKEEVRRHPDADFAPYIQTTASEIMARSNRSHEKSCSEAVIESLLRDLYEWDTQALRSDIAGILAADTADAPAPSRSDLFQCLCQALSLRTNKDFAAILARCSLLKDAARLDGGDAETWRREGRYLPAELIQRAIELNLSDFREEVLRDPDADDTARIQELSQKLTVRESPYDRDEVIISLLLDLYDGEIEPLELMITKIIVFGPRESSLIHRTALLRRLCEMLSLRSEEDFAGILAMCGEDADFPF